MRHSHRKSLQPQESANTDRDEKLEFTGTPMLFQFSYLVIHVRGSPISISKKGKVTYDRLNGVTGWVERKGIGIHAWYAAGAGRAWWRCSQTGGDTRGDAGCQWAPHWENTQYVLKQEF